MDPDAGLANVRRWDSIPGDFVGIWLEYTLLIACRCTESCKKVSQTFPFLGLELTQVRDSSLFFHPLGWVCCVLRVRKEIWNNLGRRWETPLDELMAMSGLEGWNSGGRPAVYCHAVASWLIYWLQTSLYACSNSDQAITFPFGNVTNLLFSLAMG